MHANADWPENATARNAAGAECSQNALQCSIRRMQPIENVPECNRMHHVECTQNAPTEMQRECSNRNECNVSEMHHNAT